MKKAITKETTVTKTKTVPAPQKAKPAKTEPIVKSKPVPKTYSLVIEGLTKTQAEALLKFFQKGAPCKII